jgi:PAS domain S-box-containing protein
MPKAKTELFARKKTHPPQTQQARPYYSKLLQQLSASKARLEEDRIRTEAMVNSLSEGLIEVDEHSHIVTVTPTHLTRSALRRDELIGAWLPSVITAIDHYGRPVDKLDQPLTRALATGRPISERTHYLKRGGSIMPVFTTVSPILVNGRHTGAIEVFRDLTGEQQLDIAKDEFVSLASHQLRTPATGVKLILSMLSKGDFGPLLPPSSSATCKRPSKAITANSRSSMICSMWPGSMPEKWNSTPNA